jgi:SAM-dependent methyltransferase
MKQFEEIRATHQRIFDGLNGYGASFIERQQKIDDNYVKNLIYGEIPLELLYALHVLEPTKSLMTDRRTFYDLGSGIGNVVLGSYLIGNFEKYVGIELLDSLYQMSLVAKKNLCKIDKNAENSVILKHGNMLDFDLTEGEVLLFCCPSSEEGIRAEMEEKFLGLKKGAVILSLIHVFKDRENFSLLDSRMVRMGWGPTPLMVYRRF